MKFIPEPRINDMGVIYSYWKSQDISFLWVLFIKGIWPWLVWFSWLDIVHAPKG